MSSALVSEVTALTKKAQGGIVTHDVTVPQGLTSAQTTGAYPRGGLGAADPLDELMREKWEHLEASKQAGGLPGSTPFGTVVATDRDWDWLKRKRETEAYANLDAWIGKNFHTADVATRKWLQETFPEYYAARERLMIDRAKFALRIKLLKLRGPKNHKDLVLQWGLQTGRIKLDRDWDVIGAYQEPGSVNLTVERGRFTNGLFNVKRFLSSQERKDNATIKTGFNDNPFKPNGPNQWGPANGQVPGTFPMGQDVTSGVGAAGRYPEFLRNVIQAAW